MRKQQQGTEENMASEQETEREHSDPPGTFRDGRVTSVMPSCDSARARPVCFGWVTGGSHFIQ